MGQRGIESNKSLLLEVSGVPTNLVTKKLGEKLLYSLQDPLYIWKKKKVKYHFFFPLLLLVGSSGTQVPEAQTLKHRIIKMVEIFILNSITSWCNKLNSIILKIIN